MNDFFISIDKVVENMEYHNSPKDFFSQFPKAFSQVKYQVLKLETKQTYLEPGNPSFEMMASGNFEKSLRLIPEVRSSDGYLYRQLKDRGVDFIRCRPVKYPFSQYLKWEFETYKYSAEMLERIFCCLFSETATLFETIATKDFMVFDSSIAFVHDYDKDGLIQGGWVTNDLQHILMLQSVFIHIKSFSSPFMNVLID
jgi:hypothetical protein